MLGRVPGAVSYNNKLLVDSVEEVLPQLRCYDENWEAKSDIEMSLHTD